MTLCFYSCLRNLSSAILYVLNFLSFQYVSNWYKTEVGNKTAEIPWVSCCLLQSSCSLFFIVSVPFRVRKKYPKKQRLIDITVYLSMLICNMLTKRILTCEVSTRSFFIRDIKDLLGFMFFCLEELLYLKLTK